MADFNEYQHRVLKSIVEKLGTEITLAEEYERIVEGKSKLSFRERQYIVLVMARQTYLNQQADDSEQGDVD